MTLFHSIKIRAIYLNCQQKNRQEISIFLVFIAFPNQENA
eukprot:SAG31_NODE_20825_length_564_cov_1.649462_1_plen_39_part_10